MKKLKWISVLMFLAACSTTSMVVSWNQKDAPPREYKKIGIVVITPNTSNRATVEDALSSEFRSKGIRADATFNTFPFAGQMGQMSQYGIDTATLQKKIRERVTANNFDAIMTVALLDKQKSEEYVEGTSISIAAPVYGYPYYGYYSYAYSTVYSSGYYTTTTSYFLESNLYDVASGNLIWAAQTKTTDPSSIELEAPNYARMVVQDILTKKVLKEK